MWMGGPIVGDRFDESMNCYIHLLTCVCCEDDSESLESFLCNCWNVSDSLRVSPFGLI